ncbi:bifunctional DNA primase/polymerase [Limosilactobacillus pontis]|uniref:Bifunctional DNA primase/polymerase n=1 Tax=Limosilactobacillus pontis TaxID=35787 RepID=A0ABT7UV85_9LACO|nr:bifunctional DNA primase/polymerase [Limosilactobacillus pontis]MDM8265591.1 bifunctional DNA primase/polymerase [Limosilactobacillus pontis]
MINTLDTALILAKCGMKIYPLSAGSKVPVQGSHGEHDATSDPSTIKEWFNYNPNFNLAINLQASTLAVIDLDDHDNATNGVQNYSKYIRNHGSSYVDSLKTYTEITPRNGLHIFYKLNQDLGNKDIQLMPGVELLTGKTVIAPSFINEFNKEYRPKYQGFQSLNYNTVQKIPEWLIELANDSLKQKSNTGFTISYDSGKRTKTTLYFEMLVNGLGQKGTRNSNLASLIGGLLYRGVSANAIVELAKLANSNTPEPLSTNELERTTRSIFQRYLNSQQ